MYVKTTKGIYELTPNRKLIDYPIIDNEKLMGIKPKLFANKCYIYYGEVVAQSDNLNDLIEIQYQTDEKGVVYNLIGNGGITNEDRKLLIADTNDRIVGLIRIGDDLVKVADWDNEKGEWKFYER
jgi:hypothetical protein